MQRCEGGDAVDLAHHVLGDQRGHEEGAPTVHHPVPHRPQTHCGQVDPALGEQRDDPFEGGLVVGQLDLFGDLCAVLLVGDRRPQVTDPLAQPLGTDHLGIGVYLLVFQRRRAGVEDQYRAPDSRVTDTHVASPFPAAWA